MAQTREEIIAEMRMMHNDIGLYGDTEVCRLVGFGEDACDWYYVLQTLKGKRFYGSVVGPFESLRGVYSRYDILDNMFALNGCPHADEFVIWTGTEDDDRCLYGDAVADRHWGKAALHGRPEG